MKKKQAMAFLLSAIMTTGTAMPVFANDISGHWAEQIITKWQENGKLNGYIDGSFQPDKIITRAEFLHLLNNTTQTSFTSYADTTFSDVNKNDWFYADVTQAVDKKVTTGFSDGTFRPNEPITRAEASMMMYKAEQLEQNETATNRFTDNIPVWAKGAIGAVVDAGYLSGYQDGTFGADKGMTRAEAISALERMTQQQNKTNELATKTAELPDVITKNIVIYNQQDADKLQGKRVTGKTLLYFSEDLTLSNVDFEGEVIAIPIETEYFTETEDVSIEEDVAVGATYETIKGTQRPKTDIVIPNTTIKHIHVKVQNQGIVSINLKGTSKVGTINAEVPVTKNVNQSMPKMIITGDKAESETPVTTDIEHINVITQKPLVVKVPTNITLSEEALEKIENVIKKEDTNTTNENTTEENTNTTNENTTEENTNTTNENTTEENTNTTNENTAEENTNTTNENTTKENTTIGVEQSDINDVLASSDISQGTAEVIQAILNELNLSGDSNNINNSDNITSIVIDNSNNINNSDGTTSIIIDDTVFESVSPSPVPVVSSGMANVKFEGNNAVVEFVTGGNGDSVLLQGDNVENTILNGDITTNAGVDTINAGDGFVTAGIGEGSGPIQWNPNTGTFSFAFTKDENGLKIGADKQNTQTEEPVEQSQKIELELENINVDNISMAPEPKEKDNNEFTLTMKNAGVNTLDIKNNVFTRLSAEAQSKIKDMMVNGVQSTKITVDENSEIDTVKTNNIGELSIEGKGTVKVINPDDLSKVDVSHLLSNPNITPPGGKRSGGSSGGGGGSSSSKPSTPSEPSEPSDPEKPPVTDLEKPTDIKTANLTGLKDLTTQTAKTARVTTSDTDYTIGAVTWQKDGSDVNWTTAQTGEYTAQFTLTANEEKQFSKTPAVILNGIDLSGITVSEDRKTLTAVATVQVTKPKPPSIKPEPEIITVTLTGLTDLTTQTAQSAKVTTSDENYTIGAVTWQKDGSDVDWTTAQTGEYTAQFTLTAKEELQFSKTATVTLNETDLTDITISEDRKTLTVTTTVQVTKPVVVKPEITVVNLTGLADLTTQTAQSAKVTTSDTGYSVGAVTWTKSGTDVTDWETATAGEYTASITLTADSKHHFDSPTVKLDEGTVSNVTISDDNKTLTLTVTMQLAKTLPAKLSNLNVTIPSSNQGISQNSVVVEESGTSIDVSIDVENAVASSKVKFIIKPVGSTSADMNFTGGSTEDNDIVATVDINDNSANATLNITKAQKTNFTIRAQYVDEKGTVLSDTEKTIDVTVINNPIDYIIVDSISATPVVDEAPDNGIISVEVEANKGYTVKSVEWGKIENNDYKTLADSTFVAGTTYAVRATLEVDSRLSGVSFADVISVQGAGASNCLSNFTSVNGGTLEIVFSVGELK